MDIIEPEKHSGNRVLFSLEKAMEEIDAKKTEQAMCLLNKVRF